MSENSPEEKNNPFEDYYKTDSYDDSELQARLYAKIYYDSNVEGDSNTEDIFETIQFNNTATKTIVGSENLAHKSEEQPLASKTTEDIEKTLSINQTKFVQVNTLAGRKMDFVAHKCDNKSPGDSIVTQEKGNKENFSKKCKFFKHINNECQQKESSEKNHEAAYSKYNVVTKQMKQKLLTKQYNKDKDNSDSDDSILEVPVPPKPKPLLIDLQDSDEENNTNSATDKDDLILKKWDTASIKTYSVITPHKKRESEIMNTSSNFQNIISKSNNIYISFSNDNVNPDISTRTSICAQDFTEDIVLNCTEIQRGAKSISDIKQLSKNSKPNQRSESIKDINENGKKKSPQKLKGSNESNVNFQQVMSVTSDRKSQEKKYYENFLHNIKHDKTLVMKSCNTIMDRKRQIDNEIDSYPIQKRQCKIQNQEQNNPELQGNNSGEKYFKSMSEEMRNYYNSIRGQENFDVAKLQQGMSKDPRMWAILDEDIMPCPRQRNRFWNVRCTNCHQDGHQRCDCPSPRRASCCYMCGMKGHIESRCPQKMCLTCGKRQNTFRNTCECCRVLYCTMCDSVGHESEQCPDLWRRYHQTTDMNSAPQDPGNVMKSSRLLYCCNCTKRGHESSTCNRYRWSENFPTPAKVTNYTEGPTYTSFTSSSSKPDLITALLLPDVTENEISIPQNATNVHAITEDIETSANVSILNDNFCVPSPSQEIIYSSQMEENSESPPVTNNIWSTETKDKLRQTEVHYVPFISFTYACGYLHNKNHKDARMILKNLTKYFQNRKSMLTNLINGKIAPVFLETLVEKAIEFEVKIGFIQRRTLSLQLLAMKEYIEYLYDLLLYWLNLLDDEKDYGIDVNLSINPIKMFNVLNSRIPQLDSFATKQMSNVGPNNLQLLYNSINTTKTKLKEYKKNSKEYNNVRKLLWRMHIKLLMIVNTKFNNKNFISIFRNVMKKFEWEQHHMGQILDTATYFRLILLYNHIFVPHTPNRIDELIKIEKKKNNSLQMQQEPEIMIHEQGNLVDNIYSSSTSSQNIKFENSSIINNQQNNEMVVERQNVNNIPLETSKTMDYNCDEIIIEDFPTQDSQMPLNVESVSAKPKEPKTNKDQLLTSKVNIEPIVSVNKQSLIINQINNIVHTVHIAHLTKKQRRKKLKELRKMDYTKIENKYNTASCMIAMARAFKLPHMIRAADELEKRVNNQTMKPRHIQALSKLILLEEKYQKDVITCCKTLKK